MKRGVALLATLLAVALMTILVVDFTTAAALGYRSAANQADEMHAYYLARSAIEVGVSILEQQAKINEKTGLPYDGLNQPWAQAIPPIPIGGGTVSASLVDETRKLNLNLLFDPKTMTVNQAYELILARLFTSIKVSNDLLPILVDWLNPAIGGSPGGAEADYYLRLSPPYDPRNGPMPTIGDLRYVKGVDDATFVLLSRYLTVEPEMQVNVNTAPPEVLAALTPELSNDPQLVNEIVQARAQQPFRNLTDVGNLPGIGQFLQELTPLLTTRSTYFTITGEGDFAGARQRIYATFNRNPGGTAMLASWHAD